MNPSSIAPQIAVRLVRISFATDTVSVFEFVGADGGELPAASAGSHITLQLPGIGERSYSLLPSAGTGRYIIAVLRDDTGRGGSRYIHNQLRVGQLLPITPPRNHFPLTEDAVDSLFFAGGIGVTPLLTMADRLSCLGRPFAFHYASRSRGSAAFLDDIAALTQPTLHFDDEAGHAFDFGPALAGAAPAAHLYCCGPVPMMDAFIAAARARGFAEPQIHVEYFRPKDEAVTDGGFTVELARSKRSVLVAPGQTILAALRSIGISVITSCEQGICGACEARVICGIPEHRDSVLSETERRRNDAMMLCCSGAKSPVLVIDL